MMTKKTSVPASLAHDLPLLYEKSPNLFLNSSLSRVKMFFIRLPLLLRRYRFAGGYFEEGVFQRFFVALDMKVYHAMQLAVVYDCCPVAYLCDEVEVVAGEKDEVLPASQCSRILFRISTIDWGSRPIMGSSSTHSLGLCIRAPIIQIFLLHAMRVGFYL